MKKILLYTGALLLLSTVLLTGCKKDGVLKAKSSDSTVTTLASGSYYYVTTDNTRGLYALAYGGDTIYKYSATSGKAAFYTLPKVTDADTTVINKMECLTNDSLGNIYTVSTNNAGTANVLKITPSGLASTIFSDVNPDKTLPVQYIGTYNGNFYFSTSAGIYKIAPGGSSQFLVSSVNANFAIDKSGNIIYASYPQLTNNGQITLNEINPQGTQSVLIANVNTVISDGVASNIVTDNIGNIYIYVTSNSFAFLKVNTAKKVTTLLTGAFGNTDGTFKIAEIGAVNNMVADPSGNIYFSQSNNNLSNSYLRKITF